MVVMRKTIAFLSIALIVVVGISACVWLATRPKPIAGVGEIELDTRYAVSEMRNGLYRYTDESGRPYPRATKTTLDGKIVIDEEADKEYIIRYRDMEKSYCIFENNWKIFRIKFEHAGKSGVDLSFVVTKIKRGGGGLDATVKHLYGGKILKYRVKVSKTQIIMYDEARYEVDVAEDTKYVEKNVIEVFHEETLISFWRTKPEYMESMTLEGKWA